MKVFLLVVHLDLTSDLYFRGIIELDLAEKSQNTKKIRISITNIQCFILHIQNKWMMFVTVNTLMMVVNCEINFYVQTLQEKC